MTKEDAIKKVFQEQEENEKISFLSSVRHRVMRIQTVKHQIRELEKELEKEKEYLADLEYKPPTDTNLE